MNNVTLTWYLIYLQCARHAYLWVLLHFNYLVLKVYIVGLEVEIQLLRMAEYFLIKLKKKKWLPRLLFEYFIDYIFRGPNR